MLGYFSPESTEETDRSIVKTGDATLSTRSRWQDSRRFFSSIAFYWPEHVKSNLENEYTNVDSSFLPIQGIYYTVPEEHNKLRFRILEYHSWLNEPPCLHLAAYWGSSCITKDSGDARRRYACRRCSKTNASRLRRAKRTTST